MSFLSSLYRFFHLNTSISKFPSFPKLKGFFIHNNIVLFCILIDAVNLVPPSITTYPGQTIIFNCTSRGIPLRWSVFTPNINYTNLEIASNDDQVHRESMDGVFVADLIAADMSTMPVTVVSSLTVNVRAALEGSIVQCSGFNANNNNTKNESFIHVIGECNNNYNTLVKL